MTDKCSKAPFLYWWPERGTSYTDADTWMDREDRDPAFIAADIAKRDWHHNSPDYWTEEKLEIVSPDGMRRSFEIEVESVPNFIVRNTSTRLA